MINTKVQTEQLDQDWIQLINEAKNLGIEKEELKRFFLENSAKEQLVRN